MPWSADQIYALPNPEIIDFFKRISSLEKRLFLVNDLEGITSEWAREFMFSDEPNENSSKKHGLPEHGLFAIALPVSKTGYEIDFDKLEIENGYESIQELPSRLELNNDQIKLLSLLKWLNAKTKTPIFYYKCETWGGPPDEEFSVIFDQGVFIFQFELSTRKTFELKNENQFEIGKNSLQKGFEYLGMNLPTSFCALHQRSFDWERYQIN